MKKLLLFILLLGFFLNGYSQATKYGVRGGLNISNLDFTGTSLADNVHRNGFIIGFFGEYGLSKTVYVMPELQFSAEGAKQEPLQLDYLQLPVFFKFRLSEKLYIGAGPQVGLKINKVDDGIRNFAYSGVAGLEVKINHMLFADARYTYGISNIFDKDLGIKANNSTIQFGVGYKF
tara:strand:- start:3948 stop:4475 length:528 start_codon:yes stop_codon:yes gene_type:complete